MSLISEVVALEPEAAARVWVALNRWQWPAELSESLKPYWWNNEDQRSHQRQFGLTNVIMEHIAETIPDELIDAEWKRATEAP